MTAPALQLYDSTGVTQNPTLTFSPTNGVASAAQTLRLYNDKGGTLTADTAEDVLVTAISCDSGTEEYSAQDVFAASGYLEARAVDAIGTGIVVEVTPWTPVGGGRFLALRPIPSDCYRELEFRIVIPGGAGTVAKDVRVRAYHSGESAVLQDGTYESGAQGIACCLGDGQTTGILDGGALTEAGTPDNTVEVADVTWLHEGEPQTKLAHALTFDNEDVNTDALASGEAYPVTLSLGAGPDVTETKGEKATAPLDPDAWPAVPDGEELLGRVTVPYDATIEQADIDQSDRRFIGFAWESSGLTFYVHGGVSVCGGRLIRKGSKISTTLTSSATDFVWQNPDRTLLTTSDETAPNARALLLYEVTNDGSEVTEVIDRRTWIGPNLYVLTLHKDGALTSGTGKAYGALPRNSRAYLLPLSVLFALGAAGSTSGSTIADVEYSEDGASWASIFPAAASGQRPEIAHSASPPIDVGSRPTKLSFRGGTRFRMNLPAVPGTASSDAWIALPFVFPA